MIDPDQLRAAALTSLSRREAEALLGEPFDKEAQTLWYNTRGRAKLKKEKEAKDKSLLAKPSGGSIIAKQTQNLQTQPSVASRYDKKQIVLTVEKCRGLTASICSALDCTRRQWHAYLKRHPDVKEMQDEARSAVIERAEEVVSDNLEDPDPAVRERAAEYILGRYTPRNFQVKIELDEQKRLKEIQTIFGLSQEAAPDAI